MRRLLAAAALAVLCATAAACGDSADPTDGPPSPPPGLGSPAAGPDNTNQVCADAKKVITDSTEKFSGELTKAMTAAASGGDAANEEAVNAVKSMFTDWADGLREQADKATGEELKAALNDFADQIAKLADSIKSLDDLEQAETLMDGAGLETAGEKIESICGP